MDLVVGAQISLLGSGEEGRRQRGQVAQSPRVWVPALVLHGVGLGHAAGCSVPQFLLCPAEILLASHSQVTLGQWPE